jgi:two-component system phosphate regulon sensor histidine kinase PhoR
VLKDPAIVKTPERLLNYATLIENENRRLKQQVDRVLQMAQLEKEDIGLKKETTDVHELIHTAVRNNTTAVQGRNGDIALNLEAKNSSAHIDALHFTNVLYNLIDNAIKYNREAPHIVISTKNINGSLSVSVSDNGIGISPDDQKKIFHKFYRVPTGNIHDVKGFGLGLHYVKHIVEMHHGRISVSSTVNTGSTFTIILPLSKT